MTVATRPSPRAGEVAGLEAQARLAQASFTVDEQPERFIELVRAAPVEQLRNVAPRLLELLSAKTFGLQRFGEATPREVAVRAVLRAGYPWALELEPEDVAFVREQETSARRARRRSVLRRLVPLGLALLGFGFVVNGFVRVVSARRPENAVTVQPRSVTLHPPRSRPVAPDVSAATLDELVPAADLAQAARPVADRIAREAEVAAQFEGYRRQLARVLAHAAREGCEAEPPSPDESRPIACP